MAERRILYICEGLQDEPAFLDRLMSEAFPSIHYRIYPYRTTIHTLASKLASEYDDFDSGDYEIQLILREMEDDSDLKNLLSEPYSDIILCFDFDPHHDHPEFGIVKRMLDYFTDSSDMGKLYINYPMMQSYKHLKGLPDPGYFARCASPYGYKELVGNESRFTDLGKYGYETFIGIAVLNVAKTWGILNDSYVIPTINQYIGIDWSELFDKELELYWKNDVTHVLNTLIFSLIDYNPTAFFTMIKRHPDKYVVC